MSQRRTRSVTLIMVVLILVAAAAFLIGQPWYERRQSLLMQQRLQVMYQTTDPSVPAQTTQPTPTTAASRPTATLPPAETGNPSLPETETTFIQPQFLNLLELNHDVIGWISIPGTQIDYPFAQGDDNQWYLDHNLYGEEDKAGTIFMDYRMTLDGQDRHQILYGHHLRQGTMFTDLMNYKDPAFFQKNRRIILDRLDHREIWEIFSVYVTSVDFYYIETCFADDQAWLSFIEAIQSRSMHDSSIRLSADDQVLTLSTCTYEFENARFAVHARLVDTP